MADFRQPIERARQAGPVRRVVNIALGVARHSMDDDVVGLSAGLAYRFFLSIFPFAISLAALGGFAAAWLGIQNPARQVVDAIGTTIPPEMASIIQEEIGRVIDQRNGGLLTFGALAAIFFASGGTTALIKATNAAYNVEESRPIVRRYLLAIGLTVLAGASIILAFILIVTGQLFGREIARAVGLEGTFDLALSLARWPVAFVLLFLAVLVLYRVAPNLTLPWRRVAAGALLFSVGWLVVTWGFALYVSTLASYGATFGALAGVAVLLIWFYLTALVLLVGAELNAVLDLVARPGELERAQRDAHEINERRAVAARTSGSAEGRTG